MLEGLVVLEVSGEVAVRFCGWLFARNGASVLTSHDGCPDAPLDAFLDAGKRRVGPHPVASEHRPHVILGDDRRPWDRAGAEVTGEILTAGAGSPPGAPVSEAVLAAAGGAAAFTLDTEGRPVVVGGHRYQYLAGAYLYSAALAALTGARPGSSAPHVTVDLLESVLATLPYPTTQYEYNGSDGTQQQSGPRFVLPCTDGWVAVYAGARWEGISSLLDDLLDDVDRERFASVNERFRDLGAYHDLFSAWAAGRDVEQAVADGVTHSVAISALRSPAQVLDDEDLVTTGAWLAADLGGETVRIPGLAIRNDGLLPDEIAGRVELGRPPAAPCRPVAPSRAVELDGLPLAGMRVLDLTHIWSGPLATRVLAGLGAEVVRVENPGRPDSLRGKPGDIESRYPADGLGADYVNRNAWFNTHNTDKLSVLADLKVEADRQRFLALTADSDMVIANYRPGVLERLGIGLDDLRAVNPDILLVEMPGHFRTSRHANAAVYGAQMEAASGAPFVLGGFEAPVLTGYAFGDPAGGLTAAVAAITALAHRRFTGVAAHVEISQSQSMLAMIGEELARWQGEGDLSRPRATMIEVTSGRHLVLEPDGRGPEEIDRALRAAGWRPVGGIDRHDGADGGSGPDPMAVAEALRRSGISAAVVTLGSELLDDPHLARRGFFSTLDHGACGRHRYPALPVEVDGRRLGAVWPAPLLGEHQDLFEAWSSDDPTPPRG